jgi:hypothetical protein
MNFRLALLSIVIAVFAVLPTTADLALAQPELPRPSPSATVDQTIGLTEFKVTYSRPGAKGRTIWGELVPYDEVWRTGANEATNFTTSDDITIGGQTLSAGTYALLTIPTSETWTVIFNKDADQWGSNGYKEEEDAVRIQVTPEAAGHREWMSFTFENLETSRGELVLRWDELRVPISIEVNVFEQALESARTSMASVEADNWRTPYVCASFCANNKINLEEALGWADASIAVEANYLNYNAKAKLLAELGRTEEAIAAGEKAIDLGKNGERTFDTRATERLVAEWSSASK